MRLTRWHFFLLPFSFILVLDQLSKEWVLQNLDLYESIPVLPPYFQITRSYNTGAAFGIGGGASPLFLVLALIISAGLVYYVTQLPPALRRQAAAFGLIVGGALGNVIDRLQHGVVVDFFHLSLPGVIANVSNFADHAIVIGVLALLVDNFRQERAAAATTATATPGDPPPAT
ncbi:MAG: signal peptidase II [Anaerolineae bacterium]|jgi:signal peptidase II|nr:signal peptidase II [Anaerolineae bacterium]